MLTIVGSLKLLSEYIAHAFSHFVEEAGELAAANGRGRRRGSAQRTRRRRP
jgi:hypothetical protein